MATESYLPPIEIPVMAVYMNMYRDTGGAIVYSTWEWSGDTNGLYSYADALDEAFRLCVVGEYTYICTLSNLPKDITLKMSRDLDRLERLAIEAQEMGMDLSAETAESLQLSIEECSSNYPAQVRGDYYRGQI